MKCLAEGYFSISTVKPIEKVFDFEEMKARLRTLISSREWFCLAGIRRVGKTTLMRSLITSMRVPHAYINLWNLDGDRPVDDLLRRVYGSILRMALPRRAIKIRKVSLFGASVEIENKEREISLEDAVERLPKGTYIIIDEVQEVEAHKNEFARLISWLYDTFSSRVSVAILGSVASVKSIFEGTGAEPLYGRVVREEVLKPMSVGRAVDFLKAGFEECGVEVSEGVLLSAVELVGTITGWLVLFGRSYVVELSSSGSPPSVAKVAESVAREARKEVFWEIARMLRGKRRPNVYMRILKLVASNPYISLAELSRALGRRKPTVLQYLDYLKARSIVESEGGRYFIPDPMLRRAVLHPDFEREVKLRL